MHTQGVLTITSHESYKSHESAQSVVSLTANVAVEGVPSWSIGLPATGASANENLVLLLRRVADTLEASPEGYSPTYKTPADHPFRSRDEADVAREMVHAAGVGTGAVRISATGAFYFWVGERSIVNSPAGAVAAIRSGGATAR